MKYPEKKLFGCFTIKSELLQTENIIFLKLLMQLIIKNSFKWASS